MVKVLGLDLGTSSIGWALVNDPENVDKKGEIIATGVRIFPEGVARTNNGAEQPKNQERREKRSVRRQVYRRAHRKSTLKNEMQKVGLWPTDEKSIDELIQKDPYELRNRALNEQVALHELGRIFLHLTQRRGFKSLKKGGDEDSETVEKDTSEIKELMDKFNSETLGQLFYQMTLKYPEKGDPKVKIRGRRTLRSFYIEEFDRIWETQSKFYPDLLTDALKYGEAGRKFYPVTPAPNKKELTMFEQFGVHGVVFFQRSVYWDRATIGKCDLEPKYPRAPKGHRIAQEFRIWNEINNLRYIYELSDEEGYGYETIELTPEQKLQLATELEYKKSFSFNQIAKKLQLRENGQFTIEIGERGKAAMIGNIPNYDIEKVLGESFKSMSEDNKNELNRILLDDRLDEERALPQLLKTGISEDEAKEVWNVVAPKMMSGRMAYSLKAMRKLLPHLRDGADLENKGDDNREQSAISLAGYATSWDRRKRDGVQDLGLPPRLPNPFVSQALHEVRKLVNAIIAEYSMPDRIHVELAREAKLGADARNKVSKDQRAREKEREKARDEISEFIKSPSRKDIDKYMLWKEQGGTCAYSGHKISLAELCSGKTEIDHILPRFRSLDDSLMNKVVCFSKMNHEKGNKTPFEWLAHSDPASYEFVIKNAIENNFPRPKLHRLRAENVDVDDFIQKQLSDTRYISREVKEYLGQLALPIVCVTGQLTSKLRREWGLNHILSDTGEKTREDHRHHAVDAVTIAFTSRKHVKDFSNAIKRRKETESRVSFEPWEGFRKDVADKIEQIVVSHKVTSKPKGGFHEDTVFGATKKSYSEVQSNRGHAKDWVEKEGVYVTRRDLTSLENWKHIAKIRDNSVRKIVTDKLLEAECKEKSNEWKAVLSEITMPSGIPIKRVRTLENKTTLRPRSKDAPYQFVNPGNNHLIRFFENTVKGSWRAEVLTTWDAVNKSSDFGVPKKDEIVLFDLVAGDSIRFIKDGVERLGVVFKIWGVQNMFSYKSILDARQNSIIGKENSYFSAKSAQAVSLQKVHIDILGRVKVQGK